jgi:hypothetical protein
MYESIREAGGVGAFGHIRIAFVESTTDPTNRALTHMTNNQTETNQVGQNLERLRSQSEELLLVIEDEIRYMAKGACVRIF